MEQNGKINCPNCGAEIDEGAAFCPSCGIRRKMQAPPQTPTPQFGYQPTPAPYYCSPQGQFRQKPPKERFIGFIFVVTLIMMIISVSSNGGFLTDYSDFKHLIKNLEYEKSGLSSTYYFFMTLSILEGLLLVFVFVIACIAKSKSRNPQARASIAKLLHILMIVSVAFTALFLVSAFVVYGKYDSFFDSAQKWNDSHESTKETNLMLLFQSYLNGAIMYGLVYLGLGFAGIFKSASFKRLMEANAKQSQQTQQVQANNDNVFGL